MASSSDSNPTPPATAIAAGDIARADECPGCDGAGDGGYGVPCSICGGTGRNTAAPKAASIPESARRLAARMGVEFVPHDAPKAESEDGATGLRIGGGIVLYSRGGYAISPAGKPFPPSADAYTFYPLPDAVIAALASTTDATEGGQ